MALFCLENYPSERHSTLSEYSRCGRGISKIKTTLKLKVLSFFSKCIVNELTRCGDFFDIDLNILKVDRFPSRDLIRASVDLAREELCVATCVIAAGRGPCEKGLLN